MASGQGGDGLWSIASRINWASRIDWASGEDRASEVDRVSGVDQAGWQERRDLCDWKNALQQ